MNRDTVKASFIEKQMARHILQDNINSSKYNLAPSTIKNRWTKTQKEKLIYAKDKTAEIARKNAPAIGIGVLATALFLCRKPLAKMIKQRPNN